MHPKDKMLLDAVRGGFLGLAIGDALGVPVETMSHEEILAATDGKGVTGYIEPKQTRVKDTAGLPPGSTSDDTQLALVTSRSLVRRGGFDLRDQGLALVEEFERSTFGWGSTTTAAARDIKAWRDSGGKEGRSPLDPAPAPDAPNKGCGSGPAMKVFPLAMFDLMRCFADEDSFIQHAMALGQMTHEDPRASVASVALGRAIATFALFGIGARDRPWLLGSRFLRDVRNMVLQAESAIDALPPEQPAFSSFLDAAARFTSGEVLREEVNRSFSAVHSVPFAIMTALRNPDDFRGAVLEGVNAGRDTDTIGAMVGAMVGSRVGMRGIPKEWINGLRDRDLVLAHAGTLFETMCAHAQLGIR